MATLAQVKDVQRDWFSSGNKRLFGDVSYRVLHGKKSKNPFLVRKTAGWTDMFGQPKLYFFKVNPINPETLKIGSMCKEDFADIEAVKEYLADK